jgi:hypothetical protein
MILAFVLGGVALILHQWWLFWTALGVFAAGGIVAIVVDIFSDVVLDPIHTSDADAHVSPIRRRVKDEAPAELEPKLLLFGHGPSTSREESQDTEAS